MIYEKRENGALARSIDMPEVKIVCKKPKTSQSRKEQNSFFFENTHPFSPEKKIHSGRRVPRFVLAMCVVFCVFALDKTAFDGFLMSSLRDCAVMGAKYVVQSAEQAPVNNVTLYTRLVTDAEKEPTLREKPAEVPENDVPDIREETQAVSQVSAPGFADGEKYLPITYLDLSADSPFALSNETSYSPDVKTLSEQTPKALVNINRDDGPLVLIVHTHGEECYTEHVGMYPENEATRCSDTERNVVRVGEEIANTLENFGVGTIHCTKMHDGESFINAYSSSAASVKQYLKDNPSIKVVVDVHRDAIIRDDGESVAAVTEIAGEEYAQLMFVVGTDELGHNHPDWQDNLSLALNLQKSLDNTYPTLCRNINLRNVPFNQQLSSGYLLLEAGTSANTLEQALRSARAFGENLARAVMMS